MHRECVVEFLINTNMLIAMMTAHYEVGTIFELFCPSFLPAIKFFLDFLYI